MITQVQYHNGVDVMMTNPLICMRLRIGQLRTPMSLFSAMILPSVCYACGDMRGDIGARLSCPPEPWFIGFDSYIFSALCSTFFPSLFIFALIFG